MFGISLPELFTIVCVILVLVRPVDMPVLVRYYKAAIKKVWYFQKEATTLNKSFNQSLLGEYEEDKHFVRGDDGKFYQAFDINELKSNKKARSSHGKKAVLKN